MSELSPRQKFAQLLGQDAEYLRIHADSKAPRGSFARGRKNRYAAVPAAENFGVLPRGRLVILDVDSHGKGSSIADQVRAFSALLSLDLATTLTVATPSGGRHYYLRLPEGATAKALPKTTLRSVQKLIGEISGHSIRVDADIRSAAANAYVVGPYSAINDAPYELIHEAPIAVVPEEGLKNLLLLGREAHAARRPKEDKPVDLWEDEPLAHGPEVDGLLRELPPRAFLNKLERALKKRAFTTYHQKRAFVKAALHCCYSNDAIAKACSELGVDRDSATNERLQRFSLQKDVHAFRPTLTFHGPYCALGEAKRRKPKQEWSPEALEERLGELKDVIEARRLEKPQVPRVGNSRVLDVEKISRRLLSLSNRKTPPKQYYDALTVVALFLQPLANVGAEKMLMARSALIAHTGLTDSQVAQALRLLRAAAVIEVASRQKTGIAPTYYVSEEFTHEKLTRYLRNTWAATRLSSKGATLHPAIVFDAHRGGFYQALTGELAHSNPLATKLALSHALVLEKTAAEQPSKELLGAYLRYELSWRQDHELDEPDASPSLAAEYPGKPAESLIEYEQLTVTDGWTPTSSGYRPGLQLPSSGRRNRAASRQVVYGGTLGPGGGALQRLPRNLPPPGSTFPH